MILHRNLVQQKQTPSPGFCLQQRLEFDGGEEENKSLFFFFFLNSNIFTAERLLFPHKIIILSDL